MATAGNPPPGTRPERKAAEPWNIQAAREIGAHKEELAARIMALHFERNPALAQRYSDRQRAFYLEDSGHTLTSLAAAVLLGDPAVFVDYAGWLKRLLTSRNIPTGGLPLHFECMSDALRAVLPDEQWADVNKYIEAGKEALTRQE